MPALCHTGLVSTASGREHVNEGVGARVGAAAVAAFWATLFFGIIDLSVVLPPRDERFYDFYLLETGWGLLFTFLIPVPLIAWAVRPQGWNARQILAIAASMLAAGLVALEPRQVLVALIVAASATFPHMWQPGQRWLPMRLRPRYWPVAAVVGLSVVAALTYGWRMLDAARRGVRDDNTAGLMHLPMQAALGLAISASALVAVLALANRVAGCKFAALPAAVSAVWFGVVSMAYPEHVGSIGQTGGAVAIAWGVLVVVMTYATAWFDSVVPS